MGYLLIFVGAFMCGAGWPIGAALIGLGVYINLGRK